VTLKIKGVIAVVYVELSLIQLSIQEIWANVHEMRESL